MENKLSIICLSYNHEHFVGGFIQSVLSQTNPNWELFIVDDCSTDNNVKEIEKFKDERIHLIKHNFNKGINAGINSAFSLISTKYFALIASDDLLFPDFVEVILNKISHISEDDNIGVIYSKLQCIDHDGKELPTIYSCPNLSKNSILFKLFFEGNILLSPGMVVNTDIFKMIYPVDMNHITYQDYIIHTGLLLKSEPLFIDKCLIYYRLPSSKSGISYANNKTIVLNSIEEDYLMDVFLKINSLDMLNDIFKDKLKEMDLCFDSLESKNFILGLIALESKNIYKQRWGFKLVATYLSDDKKYYYIYNKYKFNFNKFYNLADKIYLQETKIAALKKRYRKKVKILLSICLFLILLLIFCIVKV